MAWDVMLDTCGLLIAEPNATSNRLFYHSALYM